MKTSTPLHEPTPQEKLALGAARLKEQFGQLPQYAARAAMEPDPDAYWVMLAASRFETWRLPSLNDSPNPAEE